MIASPLHNTSVGSQKNIMELLLKLVREKRASRQQHSCNQMACHVPNHERLIQDGHLRVKSFHSYKTVNVSSLCIRNKRWMSFVVLNGDSLGVGFGVCPEAEIHVPHTVLIIDTTTFPRNPLKRGCFVVIPSLRAFPL